jgi:alpha-L-fucosidase
MYTPCKRDIVAELSNSCKKYDIKLGVYLSPWDRHEKTYGQGEAYDNYFCNQLTELLTRYGELYTVWFDGACGEGENGKKQIYNWDRYYSLIRKLQPNAVISSSGPDVRWCGNEAGECRESEWSVVSEELFSQSEIAKVSQAEDSTEFRRKCLEPQNKDLGSRCILKDAKKLIWYPAEVDTSIRPGWFYHESEDTCVRSLEELTNIYLKSVGGNSVLLLNIPPHKDGYITEYDTKRFKEMGDFIRNTFSHNLAENAAVVSNYPCKEHEIVSVLRNNEEFWQPVTEELPVLIEIKMDRKESIRYCVLMERIQLSQRVERFLIEAIDSDGIWQVIYEGTVIGYKKICCFSPVFTQNIRIRIMESRKNPVIQFVGLYR